MPLSFHLIEVLERVYINNIWSLGSPSALLSPHMTFCANSLFLSSYMLNKSPYSMRGSNIVVLSWRWRWKNTSSLDAMFVMKSNGNDVRRVIAIFFNYPNQMHSLWLQEVIAFRSQALPGTYRATLFIISFNLS